MPDMPDIFGRCGNKWVVGVVGCVGCVGCVRGLSGGLQLKHKLVRTHTAIRIFPIIHFGQSEMRHPIWHTRT